METCLVARCGSIAAFRTLLPLCNASCSRKLITGQHLIHSSSVTISAPPGFQSTPVFQWFGPPHASAALYSSTRRSNSSSTCSQSILRPHPSSLSLLHTHAICHLDQPQPLGERFMKLLGWMGGFYSKKATLLRSSRSLYEDCIDNLPYEEFFEACCLPDTFHSWFIVAHLHVWLIMVRLKREGPDGEYLLKQVVANFWFDVENRMKALGVGSGRTTSLYLRDLLQEFYGLTLAYEEGLLSNDKVMASALWRNMVSEKEDTDPVKLAKMVEYVRKQVHYMDTLQSSELLKGKISLLPLHSQSSHGDSHGDASHAQVG